MLTAADLFRSLRTPDAEDVQITVDGGVTCYDTGPGPFIAVVANGDDDISAVISYVLRLHRGKCRVTRSDSLREVMKDKPDVVVITELGFYARIFDESSAASIRHLGRMREKRGITFMLTLPTSTIIPSDRKYFDEHTALIGTFVSHLCAAMTRVQYSVDLSDVERHIVDSLDAFDAFMDVLERTDISAWDIETENLNAYNNRIISIQVAVDAKTAYFIPMFHKETPFIAADIRRIGKALRRYLMRGKSRYLIWHNAKFDLTVLRAQLDIPFIGHRHWDIPVGEYCLDENRISLMVRPFGEANVPKIRPYSMEWIGYKYGYVNDETVVSKDNRGSMASFSLADIEAYGWRDVIVPFQIHHFQREAAKERGDILFERTVSCLVGDYVINSIVDMELNGALIDKSYLIQAQMSDEFFERGMDNVNEKMRQSDAITRANELMLERRGATVSLFDVQPWLFSFGSNEAKQLLFSDVMRLDSETEKKDGGLSLNKAFQTRHADIPEVQLLAEYNHLSKLYGTYVKGLYKKLVGNGDSARDDRLRCSYNHFKIVTGRLSSSNPNLQNIPSRGPNSARIKRMFISSPGMVLVKADYSVHEVRNWGNVSQDAEILNMFSAGLRYKLLMRVKKSREHYRNLLKTQGDPHRVNYGFFFGMKPEEVSDEQRFRVKAIVFGVLYGKIARTLAGELGLSDKATQSLIDTMFSKYRRGKTWIDKVIRHANKTCVAISPLGRVRHLWGYLHPDRQIHRRMNRKGPNSLIQGVSSDMVMLAARELSKIAFRLNPKIKYRHANVVHDSCEFEVAVADLPAFLYLLEHAMTTRVHAVCRKVFGFPLTIPLSIDIEIGPSMDAMTEWDFSTESLCGIVRDSAAWMAEQGRPVSKADMRRFQLGAVGFNDCRQAELRAVSDAGVPAETMMSVKELNAVIKSCHTQEDDDV